MTLKLVTATPADLPKIKRIIFECFSSRRTDPFWLLKKRTKTGIAEFCSLYDDDNWVGFIYTVKNAELVYVFFWRSKKLSALKGMAVA